MALNRCPLGIIQSTNAIEQASIYFEHRPKSIESRSISAEHIGSPKPSGLGMVSIFETSAAGTLLARYCRNDACRFKLQPGRKDAGFGSFKHSHWHGSHCGKVAKAFALGIRTALASVHADDTGHVGRCRVCPKASRTLRLLR